MKLRSKILIYLIIPLGLLIKVTLFILLLSLPEGCRERDKSRLKDIESNNYITVIISPNRQI
jgi:hypothetical protein